MTDYHVLTPKPFILKIGIRSEDMQILFNNFYQNCAVFITAFNPYGVQQDTEANLAAHQRLGEHLKSLTNLVLEGEGLDPTGEWPGEKSYLTLGINRETAILLSTRAHQDAVVWIGSDAIPELLLTR